MKKYNPIQLSISFLIEFLVTYLILVIFIGVVGPDMSYLLSMLGWLLLPALVVALILFLVVNLAYGGSSKKARETFRQGLAANHFQKPATFEGRTEFVAIDSLDGRVAYVSRCNNKAFQMASSKDLSEIKSDYVHAVGGTTGIYFSFKYRGKTTRCYTFLVENGVVSLKHEKAMEGLSMADFYVEMLKHFANA